METASPPPGTLMTRINKPYVKCTSPHIILIFSDDVTVWSPAHADVNHRRINVGRGFQAEIPPLRGRTYAHSDSHNALQLWTMPDELEHPVNQQRGSHTHTNIHIIFYTHDCHWMIFWWTHFWSSWSSGDDGLLQRGARGRGQPRDCPPCPVRMQRRHPGKISLAVWSVSCGQICD